MCPQIPVRVRAFGSPLLIQKERALVKGWQAAQEEPTLSMDLGQLPQGAPLERTFYVFNNSGMDMDIEWGLQWAAPPPPSRQPSAQTQPEATPEPAGDEQQPPAGGSDGGAEGAASSAPSPTPTDADAGEAGAAATMPEPAADSEPSAINTPGATDDAAAPIDVPMPFTVHPVQLRIAGNTVAKVAVHFQSGPEHSGKQSFDVCLVGRQTVHQHSPELPRLKLDLVGAARPNGHVDIVLNKLFHAHAGVPPLPMPPLRVQLAAKTVAAHLDLDTPKDVAWRCSSCHNPAYHPSFVHTLTLSNKQMAPLAFALSLDGPFQLLDFEPSVQQDIRRWKGTASLPSMLGGAQDPIFLSPQDSVDVRIRFVPPGVADAADAEVPHAGALLVNFIHGEQQAVPLVGQVLLPKLVCDRSGLDFGRVHVKAPKPLTVIFSNHSAVDAVWSVNFPGGKAAAPKAAANRGDATDSYLQIGPYIVRPAYGVVPGANLRSPNEQRLTVTFAPKDDKEYNQTLNITLPTGDGLSLDLQGVGSFDEADEFQEQLKR